MSPGPHCPMSTVAARLARLPMLALLVFLGSCQAANAKPAAEAQIMPFHDRYNARQFAVIYDSTDATFQQTTSRDDFLKIGEGLHRKLGRVTGTTPAGYQVNVSTGGTQVTLTYRTTFEKGEGVETFHYRVRGKRASLAGYNINSPALLTD